MKRALLSIGTGLAIAALLSGIRLPLGSNVYHFLMKLRGPIQAPESIVLLTTNPGSDWRSEVEDLLLRLKDAPPRAVHLLFDRKLPSPGFPVFDQDDDRKSRGLSLPYYSSPDSLRTLTAGKSPDPFMMGPIPTGLLETIAPAACKKAAEGGPRVINVLGPPGTFARLTLPEVLEKESLLDSLRDKTVIVAAPPDSEAGRFGWFPFYRKSSVYGPEEAELVANLVHSVVEDRGIRVASRTITFALTTGVAVASVWVLFSAPPLLGMLAVVLVTALVFLTALVALGFSFYIDIKGALFAIFITYYFLIPYRLIVEYKGRWRYQAENKLLAEVETLKDNFMSLVSHNLKTPIARIEGIVETILRDPHPTSEKLNPELRNVLRSTEDLNRFITRIINLTKVEHPEYQIHTVTRDLNDIVQKVVENHRSLASEKNITIEARLEPLFPLPMDPELIQESIANLVENAIKYSPPGGVVTVSTMESGDWIRTTVADTGPGISPIDVPNIFSKFFRGAEVKNKGIRGSGLGLYLVKYFVELHGGTVDFRNREEGGSLFIVSLLRK